MRAFVIIDMQNGSFTPATPRFDAGAVIERINKLSAFFRRNGEPVIFIQHDGTKENSYIPQTADWEILSALRKEPSDIVVAKTANDAFYETELAGLLAQKEITEIVAAGCATDFCVNATIHGALTRDFTVTVIQDAHTTADRPHLHLRAQDIIAHHNWIWKELTPTKGRVRLMTTDAFLLAPPEGEPHR